MTVFISCGAKCGKSSIAQDLTVALAKGGKHYYVAFWRYFLTLKKTPVSLPTGV